jgi:hypothetical protein
MGNQNLTYDGQTFEKCDFRMLDLVVDASISLCDLRDRDFYEDFYNRHFPDLTEDEVVGSFTKLQNLGFITASSTFDLRQFVDLIPSKEEARRAFHRKDGEPLIYYALTESGGACWEFMAKANWEEFVGQSFGRHFSSLRIILRLFTGDPNKAILYLTSWSKEAIKDYIDQDKINPKYVQVGNFAPLINRMEWRTRLNWQPAYWKQFPEAHEAVLWLTYPGWPGISSLQTPTWYMYGDPDLG